jgi:cytochrome c oxidase assembly factor CtaG
MTPLLHLGHAGSLGSWHLEPSIVIGALLVLGLYIYRTGRSAEVASGARVACFMAGWLAMFLALVSPLDNAAHRLLSMHMLQHVFLTTIGPPLILLGLTPAVLEPLTRQPKLMRALKLLTNPAVSGTLFIVNMWFWHIPPVYETALDHLPVHIVMHFAFMGAGLLFWWPVIQPLPQLGRVSEGARLLYLFVTGFPMELQALLFVASGSVIYDYYDHSLGLWGLPPLEDQQIAGLIMGGLGEVASFVGITWLFFRYLDREGTEASPQPGPADVA